MRYYLELRDFVLIGVGAVLGANVRYWLNGLFSERFGPQFPYGTLFINLTGSFVLGFLLIVLANRLPNHGGIRLAVGTGFLGAYTTFSAFSVDTVTLLERGNFLPASLYAGGSVFGSLLGAYLGIMLGRAIG